MNMLTNTISMPPGRDAGPVGCRDWLGYFPCFHYSQLQNLEGVRVVAGHHDGIDEAVALPPADSQSLAV
jgi:hypothetical protein